MFMPFQLPRRVSNETAHHMVHAQNRGPRIRQLWRTAVTYMNSVKIVVTSLRVLLSQIRERFRKLIDLTHQFLLSKLVSKQNEC
jgi:hypothetical protein